MVYVEIDFYLNLILQLGANANEWSTEWWDHCFNKTTANICIESTAEGILVKKAEKVGSVIREKTLLYGSFVKSG